MEVRGRRHEAGRDIIRAISAQSGDFAGGQDAIEDSKILHQPVHAEKGIVAVAHDHVRDIDIGQNARVIGAAVQVKLIIRAGGFADANKIPRLRA